MAGKRKGKSKTKSSKKQSPQSSSETIDNTANKKSSAELCQEFDVQDVDLEFTDADYKNLTSFSLFVRLIRPQIAAANQKFIAASKMNQIMEAKWREFEEGNPFKEEEQDKDAEEEQRDDEEDDEKDEDDAEVSDEDTIEESEIRDVDDEDEDKTEEDNSTEEYKVTVSSGEESGPVKRSSSRSSRSSKKAGKVERTGGLKIRLSGFGVRKSARERKPTKSRYFDSTQSDDDASDASGKVSRSRKRKRVIESDDEFSDEKPRRSVRDRHGSRTSKRRREPSSSSDKDSSSEGDSDDSMMNDRPRRKKKKNSSKKQPVKPVIPGERKSDRARRSGTSKDLTDRDFEKLLIQQEKEKEKKQKEKEKRRQKAAEEKQKIEGKKGRWQDDNAVDSGEESDHFWYCQICQDGGDLILCDGCPKSYHKKCLKIEGGLPEGEWKCPLCMGEELPEKSSGDEESDEAESHDHYCKECKEGGNLLLCDSCPLAYHLACINPPLKRIPEDDWSCPRCEWREKPLKGTIQKILTWRWVNQGKVEDELDHSTSPRKRSMSMSMTEEEQFEVKPSRELYVKYKYHSYWDCEFVPELQAEVHQPITYKNFLTKWDVEEAPMPSELDSRKHKGDDPHHLVERYYKWGVKPEWLQIFRVVTHERERGKMNKFLIKWRDRPYEDATWEAEDDLPEGLQDWQKHVDAYWTRRKERLDGNKKKNEKKPKKKDWKKQLTEQPDYISVCGGKLHPYQLEGLNWMRFSWAQDTNVILADEMGLGKTIQGISFLYSLWKEGMAPGPFLISAPLSTVANWEREFEFWAPDMYLVVYGGGKDNRAIIREREFCYKEGSQNSYARANKMRAGFPVKFDVLLTSYEYPHLDSALLGSIPWSSLVIDEAHRLKSNTSLLFRCLNQYKFDYRLLLTGTPLQNNLEELFNLLNFLEPDKFTNMEGFLEEFASISKDDQVQRLHDMLAPHMLRRLKSDVLKDIPDKSEFIIRVELSPMQKKFYKHILTKNFHALNVKGYGHGTSLANIMMDLRKCCNHPYLFPSGVKDALVKKSGAYEGKALVEASGKLILLEKMLVQLRIQKHRVLIFSQMTRMIDLLEDFLEHLQMPYERIDGNVVGGVRQERIDRFNDPNSKSFVFLLSTKAGGLGINLATADTVIIYDMDWNPHNDIQAFSRAHRIGQKNKVMIYRFVSRASVEEKMTQVCKEKLMLSELVIAKRGIQSDSLSKQEVNAILKFGAEELFKEDKEDDKTKEVTYDDEAVRKMLDRTQEGEKQVEKSFGLNEYLRSFKVATYQVKDTVEEEEEEEKQEKEEEAPPPKALEPDDDDHAYWQRVLGDAYAEHLQQLEREQAEIQKTLGKGKRLRKRINYAETALVEFMSEKDKKKMMNVEVLAVDADNDQEYFSDYKPDHSDDESEGGAEDDEDDEDYVEKECLTKEERLVAEQNAREKQRKEMLEKQRSALATKRAEYEKAQKQRQTEETLPPLLAKKEMLEKQRSALAKRRGEYEKAQKQRQAEETLPPLLAKVNNNIEVLGFTARQRRVFLDTVMRYGIPPDDAYQSQWLVRDLRAKSERVFKAYTALFMRHLCEPLHDGAEKFADGVPVEGLSRNHVLVRIGIISVMKRKVLEYEPYNGIESMSPLMKSLVQQSKVIKIQEKPSHKANIEANRSLIINIQDKPVKTTVPVVNGEKPTGHETIVDLVSPVKEKKKITQDDVMVLDKDDKDEKHGDSDVEMVDQEGDKATDNAEKKSGEKDGNAHSDQVGEKKNTEDDDIEMIEDATETRRESQAIPDKQGNDGDKRSDEKTNRKTADDIAGEDAKKDESETIQPEETSKADVSVEILDGEDNNMDTNESKECEQISQVDGANDSDNEDEKTSKGEKEQGTSNDTSSKELEKPDSGKNSVEPEGEDIAVKSISAATATASTSKVAMDTDDPSAKLDKSSSETPVKETGEEIETSNKLKESGQSKKESDQSEKIKESAESDLIKTTSEPSPGKDSTKGSSKTAGSAEKSTPEKPESDGQETNETSPTNDLTKNNEQDISRTSTPSTHTTQSDNNSPIVVTSTTENTSPAPRPGSTPSARPNSTSGIDPEVAAARAKEERMARMRKIMWVSDGGFTELHAVWNHEEALLKPGRDWQLWHRRHDYWLLVGVITHGYRHWHDILNDPRFEILNLAFRTDVDRMKRAAFLNRRFQLLEQALVIEQQLRRAARQNNTHFEAARSELEEMPSVLKPIDELAVLDQFASNLRKMSHGQKIRGPAPDSNIHSAISGLSSLIGDIKQMTYKSMPSTLSMTDMGAHSTSKAKPITVPGDKKRVITIT